MAIEIRELVIKAVITNPTAEAHVPEQVAGNPVVKAAIVQESVAQVLKIISKGKKR